MSQLANNVIAVKRNMNIKPDPRPAPVPKVEPMPQPIAVEAIPVKSKRSRLWSLSFLAVVLVPLAIWAGYLWGFAADRYETGFSFSVRSETAQPPGGAAMAAMMGGGGSAASDAGVVADFITSREMVTRLSAAGLDLGAMFSVAADRDPVFSLRGGHSLEEVSDYWKHAVTAERDPQTGIVRVSVTAFAPQDAKNIADAALGESQKLVDELSEQAKTDVMRTSEVEVARAQEDRDAARAALSDFRVENGIVDPESSLAGRTRILDELRSELDKAILARANVAANARPDDVRLAQADVTIRNLEDMIARRSAEFGDERGYARLASQYEDLTAKAEFAEITLRNAMTVRDAARKEADMRGAYLTSHVLPHAPELSARPARVESMVLAAAILLAFWLLSMLIATSVRERA